MRAIYFDASVSRVLTTQALKHLWGGAVYAPSSPIHFVDLPEPELPGDRWIRVENRLCGICASDLRFVFVELDPKAHVAAVPAYERYFLGHEVVSTVTEVGPAVEGLKEGDRVAMMSRYLGPTCRSLGIEPRCTACERGHYALCIHQSSGTGPRGVGGGWGDGYTCHQSEVWHVPEAMSDEQAALLEPLACSVRGALKGLPEPEERALVIGCGMIGLGVVQAIRALQPEAAVYAAARYPQQVEAAERFGATVLEPGDLLERAAEVTDGRIFRGVLGNRTLVGGFDVVYDCVGSASTLGLALRLTRALGTVVLVGLSLGRYKKIDLTPVWAQEVTLLGAITHGMESWHGEQVSTFDLTARLLLEGKLETEGIITHRFPLERWKDAVRTATDKRSGAIKVAFEMVGR